MTSKIRFVYNPISVLIVIAVGVPGSICQSGNRNVTNKLNETVVIPKLGPRSDCPECGRDTFDLSPDGDRLAHMQTDYESNGAGARYTVEVRDTQTSHIITTFQMPEPPYARETAGRAVQNTDHLHYCDSGKYLLASTGYGKVYVLDTKTYQPHTIIDIDYAAIRATPIGHARGGGFSQVSCAANGPLVAFLVSGVTKVFDLDTGKEIGLAEDIFSWPGIDEVAVSPSGDKTAILEDGHIYDGKFSGGDDWKIVVVDMQKQTILSQIHLGGIGADPFSPPVMFAGESMVAMMKPLVPENNYGRESLHFWNAATGSEAQVINNLAPGADDVSYPGLSADGRTVLVYTAKSRGKDGSEVKDVHFFLWDREAGRTIAMPQSVNVIHHGCPIIQYIGRCNAFDEEPFLALSQSGNAVVAWWASGGKPVIVYASNSQVAGH